MTGTTPEEANSRGKELLLDAPLDPGPLAPDGGRSRPPPTGEPPRARAFGFLGHEDDRVEEFEIDDFVQQRKLRAAIDELPQEQRRPVLLAYFGGKTHVEIAKELAEPLGTVKSRISLGLRKLGAALKEGGP